MLLPSLTFPDTLSQHTRMELEHLISQLHRSFRSIGTWKDVPYDAGNFSANNAMVWTVAEPDQVTFQYMVQTRTMWLNAYIDNTTIGGTPSSLLYLTIPGGYRAAKKVQCAVPLFDNGTGATAWARATPDSTRIEIGRLDGANYSASTNATFVRVMMTFEVY